MATPQTAGSRKLMCFGTKNAPRLSLPFEARCEWVECFQRVMSTCPEAVDVDARCSAHMCRRAYERTYSVVTQRTLGSPRRCLVPKLERSTSSHIAYLMMGVLSEMSWRGEAQGSGQGIGVGIMLACDVHARMHV